MHYNINLQRRYCQFINTQDIKAKKKQLEILDQLFGHHPLIVTIAGETTLVGDLDDSISPISVELSSAHFFRDAGAFGETELADAYIRVI